VSVNDMTWDLRDRSSRTPLSGYLTGKTTRGSMPTGTAPRQLMAEAVEAALAPGRKFGVGPAIEAGFYYDIDLGDHSLTSEDLGRIEQKMVELSKRDAPYRRELLDWKDAVEYFRRRGPVQAGAPRRASGRRDLPLPSWGVHRPLCRAPHPSTGRIKAVKLLNVAGAYWRGSEERNKMLQRIYGITFRRRRN